MDQLDPGLVQRVNAKVSTVVERYLLDDQDVTPKNTRKAYGPKQAEWMVSSHTRPYQALLRYRAWRTNCKGVGCGG